MPTHGAGRAAILLGLAAAFAIGAWVTLLVAAGSAALVAFDETLMDATRGWADPAGWPVVASDWLGAVTEPLWSGIAAAGFGAVLLLRRFVAAAALLAFSGVVGAVTTTLMKLAAQRERPPSAVGYVESLQTSFPSGHAAAGIYLALASGLILLRLGQAAGSRGTVAAGGILIVLGPVIGLSRLVLGVHWPSDIIAGWAFGSAALCAGALLLFGPLDGGWARRPPQVEGSKR